MKRYIIHIITLLLLSLTISSCEDGITPVNIKDENRLWLLSEYSEYCYPANDKWTVSDSYVPTINDFKDIRLALIEAYNKNREITLSYPKLTAIPDASSDASGALNRCHALKSVTLSSAKTIGDYAFAYCRNLASISIPEAKRIGVNAFLYCDKLTAINLPAATTIDDSAFGAYNNLTSIYLPRTTSIGSYAFAYCNILTRATIATKATIVTIASNAFEDTDTSKITLITGSANSKYVSGNTLTVGDFSATFKDIIIE